MAAMTCSELIGIMAEKYGKDVECTEANDGGNDWMLYLGEEPNQLRNC
jgi:hypothetical protein